MRRDAPLAAARLNPHGSPDAGAWVLLRAFEAPPQSRWANGTRMSGETTALTGPDLSLGIDAKDLPEDGMLVGHAGGEAVLLARHAGEVFAIEAKCSHYGGPLGEGLLV